MVNTNTPNWLDKHHLGFVNLIAYALLPHSRGEMERMMERPTKNEEVNTLWPRPWLYLRTLVLFVVMFAMLYACWRLEGRGDASTLLPGLVIVGTLAVPMTLLIFFWEINKWREPMFLDVLKQFLIGSCVAVVITFGMQYALDYVPDYRIVWNSRGNYFTPRLMLNVGIIPIALDALIEEMAKTVIILVFLMSNGRRCHILQGMLMGATVGTGFAVFESAGYAFADINHLLESIMVRSFLAPTCHIAWGALIGGCTVMIAHGELRLSIIFRPLFVILLMSVCLLHFAWNFFLTYSATLNAILQLSIFTWFLLMLVMWRGVKER